MSLADLEIIRAFMRNAHQIDDEELTEEEVEELKKERQGKRSGDGRVNKKKDEKEGSKEEREYDQAQAQKADSTAVERDDAGDVPREILGALTMEQISRGTGLTMQRVRQAMVKAVEIKAAGQFVHWAHPQDPSQTRYALHDHAVRHNLTGWNHGIDFRNEE